MRCVANVPRGLPAPLAHTGLAWRQNGSCIRHSSSCKTIHSQWSYILKGCVQQARKWLFRPKFFSLSKWAQFLHVTLDLTGKRCPVIFSAVLFFVFEKFSSTSTGGKCALRWFYCLEKQKLSLERTPPGKKLRFCIRYLWKMKEKPADLNGGLCFWAILKKIALSRTEFWTVYLCFYVCIFLCMGYVTPMRLKLLYWPIIHQWNCPI